jgi:hypothetical protein
MSTRTSTRWLAIATLAFVAAASDAQERQIRTVVRTGYSTLFPGHSVRVHVAQLAGGDPSNVEVTLKILNDRGAQLGQIQGVLHTGGTVRLTVRNPQNGDRSGTAVRGEAVLVTPETNIGRTAFLTLELLNDRTLDAVPATSCPIKYDPRGQTGPVGNCGCELVSDFTPG